MNAHDHGQPGRKVPPRTPQMRRIRPPSFSPGGMWDSFKNFFRYRDLLITLSLHRLDVRYKQSALGWAWAVLQPLLLMLVYTVIFSLFTRMPNEGVPYALFVFSALLPWTFFASMVTNSATSLVSHSQLITKVYFPREILPLTYIVVAFVDFVIAAVVMACMMVYYHVPPSLNLLYVIPIIAVLTAFGTALALILSTLQVQIRDIGLAMPLLMQLWMFASPVVYPLSSVPVRFRKLYDLNPLAGTVEGFRRVVIQHQPPEFASFAEAAWISLILLPLAYGFFKLREAWMADII